MTGFKSGASDDDPLGNDDSDDTAGADRANTPKSQSTESTLSESNSDTTSDSSPTPTTGLPWIFERSSITDGRKKTVQLHLQQSTLDAQRQTRSDIESELGETVKKADLREAALIVGLRQTEELTEILEEWGYGR